MDRVRDAMVSEPRALPGDASARDAGELLTRPEVRAVFVVDGDLLTGVVTRKTLVARVVAEGRDPGTTQLASIAEEPLYMIGPEVALEEAFHFLEEHDAERVPVVEEGRLIGVLSRSVLQRRLAEDEPPDSSQQLHESAGADS
jgi:CBS domain-containing protein